MFSFMRNSHYTVYVYSTCNCFYVSVLAKPEMVQFKRYSNVKVHIFENQNLVTSWCNPRRLQFRSTTIRNRIPRSAPGSVAIYALLFMGQNITNFVNLGDNRETIVVDFWNFQVQSRQVSENKISLMTTL